MKPEERTVSEVDQIYFEVADRDKPLGLLEVLKTYAPEQAIIFRRTQIGVDWLQRVLSAEGHYAESLHGNIQQRVRERVLDKFRDGEVKLLIATNVAARGLDIPDVTHVINYDVPEESESYIHRVGRTARMGRKGMAITFVSEWDGEAFEAIKKAVGPASRQEQVGPLSIGLNRQRRASMDLHYDGEIWIKKVEVGTLGNNAYFLIDPDSKDALLIDAAWEPNKLIAEAEGLNVLKVLTTHGHKDHHQAFDPVRKALGVPVVLVRSIATCLPRRQTSRSQKATSSNLDAIRSSPCTHPGTPRAARAF